MVDGRPEGASGGADRPLQACAGGSLRHVAAISFEIPHLSGNTLPPRARSGHAVFPRWARLLSQTHYFDSNQPLAVHIIDE